MKFSGRSLAALAMVSILSILIGCGGGGGSGSSGGSSTGTVSMSITDAKPVLPDNVTNCSVTIDEVSVHSSEGGWETLDMVRTPFTIDLLHFSDGITAEFVPPARLSSGSYTQVRLSVVSASLRFNDDSAQEVELTIPSENLKTDKNFLFEVGPKTAVDITIDFDLSKSIVVEGPAANPSYKLKPVLHIVDTELAATIVVTVITNPLFVDKAWVTVLSKDTAGDYTQEYTKVEITADDLPYPIYWLVPDEDYLVEIDYDLDGIADGDGQPVLAEDFVDGIANVNFD